MSKELLNCPFCGGEAVIRDGFCQNEFYIECCACEFEYGHYTYDDFGYTRDYGKYKSKELAIKAWNTRVDTVTDKECEEALVQLLEQLPNGRAHDLDNVFRAQTLQKALSRPQVDIKDVTELVNLLEFYADTGLSDLYNNSPEFVGRVKKLIKGNINQ